MIEILAVLGFPIAGALVLAAVGHRGSAATVNVIICLATCLAAVALTDGDLEGDHAYERLTETDLDDKAEGRVASTHAQCIAKVTSELHRSLLRGPSKANPLGADKEFRKNLRHGVALLGTFGPRPRIHEDREHGEDRQGSGNAIVEQRE